MNDSHTGNKMEYPEGVVLLDSLGDLQPSNTAQYSCAGPIVEAIEILLDT